MKLPESLRRSMAQDVAQYVDSGQSAAEIDVKYAIVSRFVSDQSGRGITFYGAIIGLCMVVAGMVWGFLGIRNQPSHDGQVQTKPGQQEPRTAKYNCIACGMG